MYPPLSFAPLKAMLLATAEHITFAEIGVFMLLFLVFVFCFFLSLVFWHFKRILALFFLVETAILFCIPYGISKISKNIIYPIEVRYDKFRPFVYTTGFNYDIEITNKSKLPLKECLLTIVPKRAGTNIIPKPKNALDSSEAESNEAESSEIKSSGENFDEMDSSAQASAKSSNPNTAESSQEQENKTQANTTKEAKNDSTNQESNYSQDFAKETPKEASKEAPKSAVQKTALDSTAESSANTAESKNAQNAQDKQAQNAESKQEDTALAEQENSQSKKPKKPKTPKPPSQTTLKFYKILDYLIPLDAFVEVLTLETPLKYNQKVRWQGIIRDYKYDENYGAQISCH